MVVIYMVVVYWLGYFFLVKFEIRLGEYEFLCRSKLLFCLLKKGNSRLILIEIVLILLIDMLFYSLKFDLDDS